MQSFVLGQKNLEWELSELTIWPGSKHVFAVSLAYFQLRAEILSSGFSLFL